MAIAQMNWGRLKFPLTDKRMEEFNQSLEHVYGLAETSAGFLWRMPDEQAASELQVLGYDGRISATVSVWETTENLYEYTYGSLHGVYLKRSHEWFEKVEGPQLVIWDVNEQDKPSFSDAFTRLEHLKMHGDHTFAHGWNSSKPNDPQ